MYGIAKLKIDTLPPTPKFLPTCQFSRIFLTANFKSFYKFLHILSMKRDLSIKESSQDFNYCFCYGSSLFTQIS